jgi:membrane associated rhomboid family serine protease
VLFCSFVTGYYILNLSASIVGASAAIMGILVAVTTYQPLNECTFVADREY